MQSKYKVLLYYCYSMIDDTAKFKHDHHIYCIENGIRGRIIIAKEGINGTISAASEVCERYVNYLRSIPGFESTQFKQEVCVSQVFQKLNVRLKKEIVHSGLHHIDPTKNAGKYVFPKDLDKMQDAILLDVRSNYEHKLGRFKNAITLDINNFRDFPSKISEILKYKNEKVVTYCTGGVKCEKASAFLIENGFTNVFQLHGGIIQYGQETNGEAFEGRCYVFDNRISVTINKKSESIISSCYICSEICPRIINCANPFCNRHVTMCKDCSIKYEGACSDSCKSHYAKRPYNDQGYYPKMLNGYNPLKGLRKK
jgi:UPF0176 protein